MRTLICLFLVLAITWIVLEAAEDNDSIHKRDKRCYYGYGGGGRGGNGGNGGGGNGGGGRGGGYWGGGG
ncbi:hypothetical protein WR25_24029 [Diploscapter pachys]|uniref:Glycine-rich protein n=1 Tax=Diploscapter pachys TaxID=2018661 RepID=A0A2A2K720_9BILA|nr:hypothetical protein WR25_24029 [Diploscapter pachys]